MWFKIGIEDIRNAVDTALELLWVPKLRARIARLDATLKSISLDDQFRA